MEEGGAEGWRRRLFSTQTLFAARLRGRGSASVYHPRYSGIDAKQIGRLPVLARPLVLMPVLKLLRATPAILKWRTRMRGEVGA